MIKYQNRVKQTLQEIEELLFLEKDLTKFKRLQLIYLLKSGEVENPSQAVRFLGVHKATLCRWWEKYEQGGLDRLLNRSVKNMKGPGNYVIPIYIIFKIETLLKKGFFKSYREIQDWLREEYQLDVSYMTVHKQFSKTQ